MTKISRPKRDKTPTPKKVFPISISGLAPLYYMCGYKGTLKNIKILLGSGKSKQKYIVTATKGNTKVVSDIELKLGKVIPLPNIDVEEDMVVQIVPEVDSDSNLIYISFDLEI